MFLSTIRVSGVSRGMFPLAIALCAGGFASSASAQWTVINLHPAGATESEARAIFGAQQSGMSNVSSGALLWNGSAPSVIHLNPGSATAVANGVSAGRQGGTVTVGTGVNARTHAALWSGTSQSLVDMHPAVAYHSIVQSMDETTQVGSFLAVDASGSTFGAGRPCMWSGSVASFVDLTPAGFETGEARGAAGGQQVGATFDNFFGTACMWYGSAESFVNLQPDSALFSAAQCTDGTYQYGVIGILEPVPGLYPARWNGSADSWVNLGIPDDHWGEVHATHGGVQVGYITDTDGISNSKACMWTGEPGTYADLHQYLPPLLTESNALGIWRHSASGTTYVVGYGLNSSTNQREAIMWVNGPGTNLITSPVAPADESAAVGQPMTYSVRVLNAGPLASGTTTLTIDLPPSGIATFASASPAPASVTATQVTFNLGSVAGSGAFIDVSITLTAVGGGSTATITATASSATEADPTNNSASASSRIQPHVCPADFDGDGTVDFFDYDSFVTCFEGGACPPGKTADFDGDGSVDFFDYDAFVVAFETPC